VVARRDFVSVEVDQLNGKWNRVESSACVCVCVCVCKENNKPLLLLSMLVFTHYSIIFITLYIYC
jgi:hypothetical protein